MNFLIVTFVLSLCFAAFEACGTIDTNNNACQDILANSNMSCVQLCIKQNLPTSICSDAQPQLEILVLEGCIPGTTLWRPFGKCLGFHISGLLNQKICITSLLLGAIKSGFIQFQLGYIIHKLSCNRYREGLQTCVTNFVSIICTSGSWKVKQVCAPGSCYINGTVPYCSTFFDMNNNISV